jgi:glycosyltransferase involved in cell wall biosynthesis
MELFVLPSCRHGFSRACMGASASGLPVTATDVRACRHVVDQGITGLVIPGRDPYALAKDIHTQGEDLAARAPYGTAGATEARRELDERRVVQTVLDTSVSIADTEGLDRVADILWATDNQP